MSIVIYLVRRVEDDKSYVGQASLYKHKDGKSYNYGSRGRISDHISSESPLGRDIKHLGIDKFEIIDLCTCDPSTADELEAKYIETHNALAPDGYNVQEHSVCKHRSETSIIEKYLPELSRVEIKAIKRDGENKLVRLYLHMENEKVIRLTFGTADETYQETYDRVIEIIDPAIKKGIPITKDYSLLDTSDPLDKYQDKIKKYDKVEISRVRITLHKSEADQIAIVLIRTKEAKSYKDEDKICFGGKNTTTDEAIDIALKFVAKLNVEGEIIVSPTIRSRQQAAAS